MLDEGRQNVQSTTRQAVPGRSAPDPQNAMKPILHLVLLGALLLLASCSNRQNWRYGSNRAYGPQPSYGSNDPFGGWDVYQSSRSTRVKHTP